MPVGKRDTRESTLMLDLRCSMPSGRKTISHIRLTLTVSTDRRCCWRDHADDRPMPGDYRPDGNVRCCPRLAMHSLPLSIGRVLMCRRIPRDLYAVASKALHAAFRHKIGPSFHAGGGEDPEDFLATYYQGRLRPSMSTRPRQTMYHASTEHRALDVH